MFETLAYHIEEHATLLKAIICTALLIAGLIGASELDGGGQWTVVNSIPYDPKAAGQREVALHCRSKSPSSADPGTEDVPLCRQLEQQILSSTVRIEIEAWISQPTGAKGSGLYQVWLVHGNGHGTIKDGRYLITHNHFSVPLPASGDADVMTFRAVSVYAANGDRLDPPGQPISLSVVGVGRETVVLDFGLIGDVGFFEATGLASAKFKAWQTLSLEEGMEVAQVDWDGKTTHVHWTTVESFIMYDGVPRLVLSDGLTPGASGGGVFWNGYHVANNWALVETVAPDGQAYKQRSTAALIDASFLARNHTQ